MNALSFGLDTRPLAGLTPAPTASAHGGRFLNPRRVAYLVALALGSLTTLAQATGWTVGAGTTLIVNGSIGGDIAVASGGTLAGGGNIGALSLASGATLAPNPATGFAVTGTLGLAGTLNLSLASAPTVGTVYTLLANDGSDAISGTFASLNEGATYTAGATTFRVSYAGGDGNDVTLTALAAAPTGSDPGTPVPASSDFVPAAPAPLEAKPGGTLTLSGTAPVSATPGSTLVIPAGASVAGTVVTLAAPSSGTSGEPVTLKIGGQSLTLSGYAPGTAVSFKKITLGGVETPVLAVTGGSVSVSGSAGQPLLALGNATLSAGKDGTTVSLSTGSDGSSLAVTGGYIVLSANAFAEVGTGNGFAALKDGKLYAGEVAQFNAAGKIGGVRLGSLGGASGQLGDSLGPVNSVDPTPKVKLQGKAARLGSDVEFADALAAALGQDFSSDGQNADGVLRLNYPGGSVNAVPLGQLAIDTDRADGATLRADGLIEVSVSGIVATFAPALPSLAELLAALPAGASAQSSAEGVLAVTYQGKTYRLRPAWLATPGGAAGFNPVEGGVIFGDGKDSYPLHPAFANYAALCAKANLEIPGATCRANLDGSVALTTASGQGYTLTARLEPGTPGADAFTRLMSGQRWWQEADGRLFINAGAVQEFEVK